MPKMKDGAPGEIRTPDLLVRSQTLYPAELRAQCWGMKCYRHVCCKVATRPRVKTKYVK